MADLTVIKRVKNAILYRDKAEQPLIRIDGMRLSYAFLGTPSEDENDDGGKTKRWRSNFLLPKETHVEAKNLCVEVIQELMKKNDAKVPKDKWFITDGDDKEDEHSQGNWIIVGADPKVRPKARNRKGEVMDDIAEIDKLFYSGAWAHALLRPWYFGGKAKGSAKTFPKRISCGLNGVLFFKDDTPFGNARVDDTDAWADAPTSSEGSNGMDDDDDL